jgi:glycosyltransferase involved in cell wall biosynthesis
MSEPTVAIITKDKTSYWKPLYEAFAKAQPEPWKTLLIWPESLVSEHPGEFVTPRAANLEIQMVPSRTLSVPRWWRKPLYQHESWQIFLPNAAQWRILKPRDIRAIVIHEYSPYTVQALIYAKLHRIPAIVSTDLGCRNGHYFSWRTRLWHHLWGGLADGIVARTPAAHQPLSKRAVPTFSAYHAVDSRIYLPKANANGTDDPVVFAYLGQLIPRKGLDLLLRAAARLRTQTSAEFRLRLIGGGDRTWLGPLLAKLDLESHVELTGFLSGAAIREALGTADVFVLPTRQDTYAVVVHEAACLGLPLLVSLHAGAAEALVEEGRNGFVFDPNDPEQFADRMSRVMSAATREPMRQASRRIGESHSAHERGKTLWEWMHAKFIAPAPRRGPTARQA